jgi:PAS domain-containing protein
MTVDHDANRARLEREVASYQVIVRRLDAYTRQLEAESRRLQGERALGQAIIDHLPDPTLVVDRNGRLIRQNQAATWLFSLPPETEATACATALCCPRCFGEDCPLRHDLAPRERQVRITGPDGMPYAFSLQAIPLDDRFLLLHFRDMTELAALLDEEVSSE